MNSPILELTEGYVAYGPTSVLAVSHLTLREGEIALIQGGNATGKTSLLLSLLGAGPTFSGQILFMGRVINGEPTYRRIQRGVRLLPQGRRAFDRLTPNQHRSLARHYLCRGDRVTAEKLTASHDNVRHAQRAASVLSGGESKLMLLDSLLAGLPQLLLLDEPFAGLEPKAIENSVSRVKNCLDQGTACLVTDHTGIFLQYFPKAKVQRIRPADNIDALFHLEVSRE